MRKQINPVVAIVIIICAVVAVGIVTYQLTVPRPPVAHVSGMARVRQPEVRQNLIQRYQQRWASPSEKHN